MSKTTCPRTPPPLLSASNGIPTVPFRKLDVEQSAAHNDLVLSRNKQDQPSSARETNVTVRIDPGIKGSRATHWFPCGGFILKILLCYGIVVTGLGGYLLRHFFRIPSLQNEIDQLSDQVDRLETEISNLHNEIQSLTTEIDRLEHVNGQLNIETINLQKEVNITEVNLAVLHSTIHQYEISLANLTAQNILWREQSSQLNTSVISLSSINDRLEDSLHVMNTSVQEYEASQTYFTQQIHNLTILTTQMNQSIVSLGEEIILYQDENTRLENLVQQLRLMVNSTQNTLNYTSTVYNEIMQDITINRNLLLQRLNSEYRTLVEKWDCDIIGRYQLKNFVINETLPIGSSSFPEFFNFLNSKVLGYLCINTTDFQTYMIDMVLPPGSHIYDANLLHIKESVMRYSALLLSYYFPGTTGGPGLTVTEWDMANYRCYNLTRPQRFMYSKIIPQYYPSLNVSHCVMQTTDFCIYEP